jgi:MmyB-like transcription regulator ligand binding domain
MANTRLVLVVDSRFDVLACNRAAAELLDGERNLLGRIFLSARDNTRNHTRDKRFGGPGSMAAIVVDVLRQRARQYPHDRELHILVGNLMLRSTLFSAWWVHPSTSHRSAAVGLGANRWLITGLDGPPDDQKW